MQRRPNVQYFVLGTLVLLLPESQGLTYRASSQRRQPSEVVPVCLDGQ